MKKQSSCLSATPWTVAHQAPLSSVQFSCSVISDSVTPWTVAHLASLSITNSQSLLKLMFIASVMPSNHLILCHPLLLPSIFPRIGVFSNESVLCIIIFYMYLLMLAALGLHCCSRAISSCGARGLLIAVASLVSEHRL